MGCGGQFMDSVTLEPTTTGIVSGHVFRQSDYGDDYPQEGATVWYCPHENRTFRLDQCAKAGYSGRGGGFRVRVPAGDWFVTFSVPDFDGSPDYCRAEIDSDAAYVGRFVTVRKGRAVDATTRCPSFYSS